MMSLLSTAAAPPMAFTASLSDLVSNAALFQFCAQALPGLKRPAAIASPITAAPPVPLQHLPATAIHELLLDRSRGIQR